MKHKMSEEKWESVKRFFDRVWAEPEKFPEKTLVISLSDEEMTQLFTKKRLELISVIRAKKPRNVTKLAELVSRDLTAVMRDLKILESIGIVSLEKSGKDVLPKIEVHTLILPLAPKPIKLEELRVPA